MSDSKYSGIPTLAQSTLVSFVPITDAAAAISFYQDKLGASLVEDQSPFALVFDLFGTPLRATFAAGFQPQPFTILGWKVSDIEASVQKLTAAGVTFTRYPWMDAATEPPIWTAPGGTRIAWFNDPFGNVLSLQSA